MRPHWFALSLGALLSVTAPALAQDTTRVEPITKPLLWQIEGRDGAPVFLFGTMHVADPRLTTLPPVVEAAVDRADALFCELDMDPVNQMREQMALAGKIMIPPPRTLKDVLSPELYGRVDAYMRKKNHGIGLQPPLTSFKPWLIGVQLLQLDLPKGDALDKVLYMRAKQAGKQVGGLETTAEQLGVFDSMSEEEQVEGLEESLDKLEEALEKGEPPHAELMKAYLSGDVAEIVKIAEKEYDPEDPDDVAFRQAMLIDRNVRMVDRIVDKLEKEPNKSFFFAVGAAHWPGEEGMLELLKQKGYEVRRLGPADAEAIGGEKGEGQRF